MSDSSSPRRTEVRWVEAPARVGRYALLQQVRAGSMGIVYAAYDPELERKVEIEILDASDDERSQTERLQEARALAKLAHPHVVSVHDVGTFAFDTPNGERWLLFVAFAHVDGRTSTAWRAERPRTRRAVLDVLVQAGEGLAAAHAAGVVHGRFEADHVLVDRNDQARVVDFGRARRIDGDGTSTDARADQFAFCVVLRDAIADEGGRNPRVPRWLSAAIDRGLADDPRDRWPSVAALLEALERGRTRARTLAIASSIAVLGLGAAVVLGIDRLDERRRISVCEDRGAAITAVWNDDARAAVRTGLLATGVSHAATTVDKVTPWLDAQADAWRTATTEACLDADVRDRWSTDVSDRSTRCLEERRSELAALVARLRDADVGTLRYAVQAAASLRHVDPCRDAVLLERLPSPPAEARDEVRAIREQLATAAALDKTGAYEEGLEHARDGLARAETLAWPPLVASARSEVGNLLMRTGEYDEATTMLEEAYFDAAMAGAPEEAFTAAEDLAYLVGSRLARPVEGERWCKLGDLQRAVLPDPAGLREARSLGAHALMRVQTGAYAEAAELYERALALTEKALGPEHPAVAVTLDRLGTARDAMGQREAAMALFRRALAVLEHALGPEHPDVAVALTNLAGVRDEMGAHDEALALYRRALAIWEATLDPDHPNLASLLNNLGSSELEAGHAKEAGRLFARALAIWEKAYGTDHANVATAINNLAVVREEMGDYAEAAQLHERAIAIRERTIGTEHPDYAMGLHNLALVRSAAGQVAEATELETRALVILERVHGPQHPDLVDPLVGLARAALAEQRPADALASAKRAVEICGTHEVAPEDAADARLVLAEAEAQLKPNP